MRANQFLLSHSYLWNQMKYFPHEFVICVVWRSSFPFLCRRKQMSHPFMFTAQPSLCLQTINHLLYLLILFSLYFDALQTDLMTPTARRRLKTPSNTSLFVNPDLGDGAAKELLLHVELSSTVQLPLLDILNQSDSEIIQTHWAPGQCQWKYTPHYFLCLLTKYGNNLQNNFKYMLSTVGSSLFLFLIKKNTSSFINWITSHFSSPFFKLKPLNTNPFAQVFYFHLPPNLLNPPRSPILMRRRRKRETTSIEGWSWQRFLSLGCG